MKKLSIHVMTTWKNIDRQKSILNTWLNNVEDYTFYTDKSTEVGNQQEVFNNDTYFSNGIKNLSELHRIYNNKLYEKYDWFLFCDDDTILNLKLVKNKLEEFNENFCYGRLINSFPQIKSLHYFSGGAGYFVSSHILKKYGPPSLELLKTSFYSDVCVGLWMENFKIPKVNIDLLHTHNPQESNIVDIKSQMSFHYIKNEFERESIFKIFNS